MKCLLCSVNEATKKNTHYLTDAIIRTALNAEGGNSRETGLYWGLSTGKAGADFGFQRSTAIAKLEEILGRSPTDEESFWEDRSTLHQRRTASISRCRFNRGTRVAD